MRKMRRGAVVVAVPVSACSGSANAVAPPQTTPRLPDNAAGSASAEPASLPPKLALLDLQKRAIAAASAAINAHDAKRYAELFAPDATVHEYGLGEANGREAIADGLQKAFDGFPDFRIGVSKVFVKNDILAQEWAITGRHTGEFNGAKPTGKTIGVRVASVLTFTREGLIKTEHRYWDTRSLVSQLGLMKSPARPVAALPSGEPEWHVAQGTADEDNLVRVAEAVNGAFEEKSEAGLRGALSEDVSWSNVTQPTDMRGMASVVQFFGMFKKAFPDARFSSVALFGVDDVVVSESSMTATHSGPLGPLKPTGKLVTLHGVDIMKVKDGKLVSGSSYSNTFELLGQEGVLPKPAPEKEDAAAGRKEADR